MIEHIHKFGGSSMAEPATVATRVEEGPSNAVVVVSAPGRSTEFDQKMTDQLIEYGDTVAHYDSVTHPNVVSARDEIIDRMDSTYSMLGEADLVELRDILRDELTPTLRFGSLGNYDGGYFASRGELFSALYFAKLIGTKAMTPAVIFDSNGILNRPKTHDAIIQSLYGKSGRIIIPGFFGEDRFRRTWTLNRGGSDRTGALYAAALGVDYTNWTDVDGIYSADPRVIGYDRARVIKELTRDEVRESANGGSGVFQGDSIVDLNGSNVNVQLRNTKNPQESGTTIVADSNRLIDARNTDIIAVSSRSDLLEVSIRDLGMAGTKGYEAAVLGEFSRLGLSVELNPQSQDSLSVIFSGKTDSDTTQRFVDFTREHNLSNKPCIDVREVAAVYAVGEALRDPKANYRALARILGLASDLDLSEATAAPTGSSPSIAVVTSRADAPKLLDAIHRAEIE
jgi:aspartate kinase